MSIQVPCTFDAANRRKDKTVGMRFTSNYEVTNEDFAEMDRLMGKTGWVLFSPNEFKDADVPKEDAPSEGKSVSQRVRAVNYVAWETMTDKSVPFDQWHSQRMEAYIQQVKDKLPERN